MGGCFKYWELQLIPEMSTVYVDIPFKNHSVGDLVMFASFTSARPGPGNNVANVSNSLASATLNQLVVTRTDNISTGTTMYLAIKGGAAGSASPPLGFDLRWRSAIELSYAQTTPAIQILSGQTLQWVIKACSTADPTANLKFTGLNTNTSATAPLKLVGCFEPEVLANSTGAVLFNNALSGTPTSNEAAVRYCLGLGKRYAWINYYELGYCADFLPSVSASTCFELTQADLAYGGPSGVVVMTTEAVIASDSLPFYVSSTSEVSLLASADGFVKGANSVQTEHALTFPETYVTVEYKASATKFPAGNTDPLTFTMSYNTDILDLCSLTPTVGAADTPTLVTLTGVNFDQDSMCLFRNATSSGAIAAPLNSTTDLTEATTLGAYSVYGEVYSTYAHGVLGWSYPTSRTTTTLVCAVPAVHSGYLNGASTRSLAINVATCAFRDQDGTNDCATIALNGTTTLVSPKHFTLELYSAPSVTVVSLFPTGHTVDFSTTINVTGTGFDLAAGSGLAMCRFGSIQTVATVINSATMLCPSPMLSEPSVVALEVSVDGQDFTSSKIVFNTFAFPTVTSFEPNLGSINSSVFVRAYGTGFVDTGQPLKLRFNDSTELVAVNASSTAIGFFTPSSYPTPGSTTVSISMDGVQWITLDPTFLFYSQPTLTAMEPSAGSVLGGTSVTLTGTGFINYGYQVCRFNDTVVAATFVSGTTLLCTAPPRATEILASVHIALDGQHFVAAPTMFQYYNSSAVSIAQVLPSSGPVSGGVVISLTGSNFDSSTLGSVCLFDRVNTVANVTLCLGACNTSVAVCTLPPRASAGLVALDFSRDFTSINSSFHSVSTQFLYHPDGVFTSVNPGAGPITGGTVVTIHGTNLHSSVVARVAAVYGTESPSNVSTTLHWISSTAVSFVMPSRTGSTMRELTVMVAINGEHYTDTGLKFTVFPQPTVTSMRPLSGPAASTTKVTITGSNFPSTVGVTCHIVQSALPTANLTNNTALFGARKLQGEWVNASSATCTIPSTLDIHNSPHAPLYVSLSFDNDWNFTGYGFQTSPSGTIDNAPVYLSLHPPSNASVLYSVPNGYPLPTRKCFAQSNQTCSFAYYPSPINVLLSTPNAGPMDGGTVVTLWGSNLSDTNTNEATCRWGSSQIGVLYTAGQQANFTAEDSTLFIPPGAAKAVVLNSSYTCVSPPWFAAAGQYYVDLALNGQDYTGTPLPFTFFQNPTLQALNPSSGPVEGGTSIQIVGTNLATSSTVLPSQTPIGCRLTGNGTKDITGSQVASSNGVAASLLCSTGTVLHMNCSTLTCFTPGVYNLSSTLNAQQYSISTLPFTMYRDPSIGAVLPTQGPLDGGTVVQVTGTGLLHTESTQCRFGSTIVDATNTFTNGEPSFTCATPKVTPSADKLRLMTLNGIPHTLSFELSLNGQKFSSLYSNGILQAFNYILPTVLTSVYPTSDTPFGGVNVTGTGSGFKASPLAVCRWKSSSFNITVAATVLGRDTIVCATPDVSAYSSSFPVVSTLTYSGNGVEWSAGFAFTFDYPAPCFTCQEPEKPKCVRTVTTVMNATTNSSYATVLSLIHI
eukprot:TRINITY_DN6198_c0_g5_i1.p1 TRINITY_DN6198_c0_g5~~TRINITY_DN6198_c0_g5_i1.p1  ORF type:complete len:1567 (-),score=246.24 TRINITY_DN6198_c0_g5_i1:2-4702(-)